jgi:hypothetical protein
MLNKITLILILCFQTTFLTLAGNPAGGQVSYRFIGNNKFEVTYKIYRDCRGIPINVANYTIRCASTSATKTLTATRVKITDISNTCKALGILCNPANQTSTSTNPIVEEHTYMDTLDFNGNESSFKSCCNIQIGVGQCCRNGAITTGGSGNDFLVISTLDLCNAPTNSSPVFVYNPLVVAFANETLTHSFMAKDTIDNDSLSYHFTDPKTSFTGKTSWSGNLNSSNPFTAYYPKGYNQANGPKPEANPPIGIYLDEQSGNLISTPIDQNQVSIIAIAVKEWRKDKSGKYIQIGEITLDYQVWFVTGNNHTPLLTSIIAHKACENEPFTLEIPTDDYPYTFPPPTAPNKNDTVTFSWEKTIKNAKYSVPNATLKLPIGKFEWTPSTGDSKKSPFMFNAIASDNNCYYVGRSIKTFKIKVYPKIKITSSLQKLNADSYKIGLSISDKTYSYVSGKTIISNNPADIRTYFLKSSNSIFSTTEIDTIVFKRNGQYIINQSFISETECNNSIVNDTINITNIMEVSLGIDPLTNTYTDTSVCQNQKTRITAKVTNAKRPVTYSWKTKTQTLSDTLGYFDQAYSADDTLFLSVKDANGNKNSTFKIVKILEIPSISAGTDKTICEGVPTVLKVKNLKSGTLNWEWTKSGIKLGTTDSLKTSEKGIYIVSAINNNGCRINDSVELENYPNIKVDLISGTYCQSKNELVQSELFSINPNLQFKSINWYLVKTLATPSGGSNFLADLVTDSDPSKDYNYKITFDYTRVVIPFNNKDSLLFRVTATDTNGCVSSDNMTISLIKNPTITLTTSSINNCVNDSLNLNLYATTSGSILWTPMTGAGYENWKSYTPTKGLLLASAFGKPGLYKIRGGATFESCTSKDSLIINVLPLPKPMVWVSMATGLVRIKDYTFNVTDRKWYINNVFYTSADTLLLSKSFAHMQPIKLEVTDKYGCTNDTTLIINTLSNSKINPSKIEIYPNPANTVLFLKQVDTWVPTSYEIYDVLGKKVLNGITASKVEMIDIQSIKPGAYYLKYNSGSGQIAITFIKSE